MMSRSAVVVGFSMALGTTAFSATTYYVDAASIGGPASNANPGTVDRPWATIAKASDTLQPGDTLYIRGGSYPGRVDPPSGSAGSPVTYKGYAGETAVLNGMLNLDGVQYFNMEDFIIDGQQEIATGIYIEGGASHVALRNFTVRNIKHPDRPSGFGIWFNRYRGGGVNVLLEDFRIHNIGDLDPLNQAGGGIHLMRGENVTIRNADIYDVWVEDGLQLDVRGRIGDRFVVDSVEEFAR